MPSSSLVGLTRPSPQGRKPYVRTPLFRQLTAVSRPPSPIADARRRRVRRRRVCFTTTRPLQYRRTPLGAVKQTRSCCLRVFGKRGYPNEPDVSPRSLWRARGPVNFGGGRRFVR